MRKKLPLLAGIIYLYTCFAPVQSQSVGIGTLTPDNNAILDIKSNTKGMLIPRTSTVSRLAIVNPAKGLMLYDTITGSFWFHNGVAWSEISQSGNVWGLTGNSGTNPANHFVGTADGQPLRFRVNNLWAGEIHPITGNIFLGIHAGLSNTTGYSNTGFGDSALKLNSLGYENTAIGIQALKYNSTASRNTALGANALFTQSFSNGGVSWQSDNVAVGYNALYLNQPFDLFTGVKNTAIGNYALQTNSIGSENTAVGYGSLVSNSVGSVNTAVGLTSLYSNTSGFSNTALGAESLYSNTGGYENTATGRWALYSNTFGYFNTANGTEALYLNINGNENTAIGKKALNHNSSSSRNTAIGTNALYTQSYSNGGVVWESGNVAVGYNALYLNQPTSVVNGFQNTAVGAYALQANSNGAYNTAIGYGALVNNFNGTDNTANGLNSLYNNTSGVHNTAIGSNALRNNTSGYSNTVIGDGALLSNVGGGFNVAIGSGAGNVGPNLSNTVGIGNNGYLIGASNQVIMGNANTTFIGGAVGFTNQSDARIKKSIAEDVKGLDFILHLRPVTYHVSINAISTITGNKEIPDFPEKYDREKIKYTGFIAQEVEQAAKIAGYDFSGVYIPQKSTELYGLRYAEFVVPLVKAMQEQQAMIISLQTQSVISKADNTKQIEQQQAIIIQLQQQVSLLEKRLTALETKQ